MTEAERYQAVQANIKDLLDKAANDKSAGGMVGFGSTWLAAELFARNEKREGKMSREELIEKLADKEHASWAHWMAYVFQKCGKQPDGSVVLSADLVTRWQRQIDTPYADLSEQEKQSDRDEVAHILPIIDEYAG